MFGCYRKNDVHDPDTYTQAIQLVLSDYPRALVEYVTDPRTGLPGREESRFGVPNAGQVRAACEAELERMRRMQQPVSRRPAPQYIERPNFPGCRTNLFVHAGAPNYETLRAWADSGEADSRDWKNDEAGRPGIWVALSIWEGIGGLRSFAKRLDYAAVGRREAESSRVKSFTDAGLAPPEKSVMSLAFYLKSGWTIETIGGKKMLVSPTKNAPADDFGDEVDA